MCTISPSVHFLSKIPSNIDTLNVKIHKALNNFIIEKLAIGYHSMTFYIETLILNVIYETALPDILRDISSLFYKNTFHVFF